MRKHWKTVRDTETTLEIEDPEGWRSAVVKWDGCVDYQRYFNEPLRESGDAHSKDVDCLHICNLDEEIERLTQLRDMMKERGWPG